jgi:hypothetical protein
MSRICSTSTLKSPSLNSQNRLCAVRSHPRQSVASRPPSEPDRSGGALTPPRQRANPIVRSNISQGDLRSKQPRCPTAAPPSPGLRCSCQGPGHWQRQQPSGGFVPLATRVPDGLRCLIYRAGQPLKGLLEPVVGIPATVERGHLLVAVPGIQLTRFDEIVTGVQPQNGYAMLSRVIF